MLYTLLCWAKRKANTFCLLLSSLHPIWLELISLSFHVMENCGKTHPILYPDRSMQLPCSSRLGSSFFIYSRGSSRIQSMVPINGAFCHSTDLLPSGYTTRQSFSGLQQLEWSLKFFTLDYSPKGEKSPETLCNTLQMSNGQTSCLMKALKLELYGYSQCIRTLHLFLKVFDDFWLMVKSTLDSQSLSPFFSRLVWPWNQGWPTRMVAWNTK